MYKGVKGGVSRKKLDFYWAPNHDRWVRLTSGVRVVKPDAPKEAQESYEHYLAQCRYFDEIYGKGQWN